MPGKSATQLWQMTAVELGRLIAKRKLSPVELLNHVFARIEKLDPRLRAFVHLDEKAARAKARRAEAQAKAGATLPPLHGLPVSVKDLVMVAGMPYTRGSALFKDAVGSENAPIVDRLINAGAIITGKTNTSELGWKGACSNPIFPETLNPWNLGRTPGGSSGGAAAACAAGLGPLHVGSDGGGSIRMPSAFTGIFGFKASHGRLPIYPPTPVGNISHVGPMTRTVADAALIYRVAAGNDERDLYGLPPDATADQTLRRGKSLRIGWSPDLGGVIKVDAAVVRACERAVQKFADVGWEVVPVEVAIDDPMATLVLHFKLGIGAALQTSPRWRQRIDPGLRRIIDQGAKLSPFALGQALIGRGRLWEQLRKTMARVDILATPTTPTTAFKAGQDCPDRWLNVDDGASRWFTLTGLFNLTGQPAASVPCGFDANGLPIGLQLIGQRYADWTVLKAAQAFEDVAPWQDHWPAIATA